MTLVLPFIWYFSAGSRWYPPRLHHLRRCQHFFNGWFQCLYPVVHGSYSQVFYCQTAYLRKSTRTCQPSTREDFTVLCRGIVRICWQNYARATTGCLHMPRPEDSATTTAAHAGPRKRSITFWLIVRDSKICGKTQGEMLRMHLVAVRVCWEAQEKVRRVNQTACRVLGRLRMC